MKLIYLEWSDALTNAQWLTRNEVESWGKGSNWFIREVGWLLQETKEYLVIAEGWKPADDWTGEQFINLHKIPKTWIKNRQNLKVKL